MTRKRKNYPNADFIWIARLDIHDPFKQRTCPQCGMSFNKGGGQGPGKMFCSRRCFTRHRKNNRVN